VDIFYFLDILLRLNRKLPDVNPCGHLVIAKSYFYNGDLVVDILSTFPFKELPLSPDYKLFDVLLKSRSADAFNYGPDAAQAMKLLRFMRI
jgi:hypothetical protein